MSINITARRTTMTGSDKGLWYFVEQTMKYNELRPKLNGKIY